MIAVTAMTCIVFFVFHRYRIMAFPILVPWAALGIENLRRKHVWLVLLPVLVFPYFWGPNATDEAIGWHNWGVAWERDGKSAQAIESYRRVLKQWPSHPETLENLSRIYLNKGEEGEAEEILLSLLKAQPRSFVGLSNLSVLEFRRKNWNAAEKAARGALDVRPASGAPKINLVLISFGRGDVRAGCEWMKSLSAGDLRNRQIQPLVTRCKL
jgi:tetratricopeptide (TPR) repeat protein